MGGSIMNGVLSALPQTIEDTISVSISLDIPYIWIDRFCVPQHECEEKQSQILNMHRIYNGAEVTIVAAAGEGSGYGLPGISRGREISQARVRVGSRDLVSTGIGLETAVENVRWSSRAWTFQEALLSRRKLVFTNHQVYFRCDQMECRESIDQDLNRVYHLGNKTELLKPYDFQSLRIDRPGNIYFLLDISLRREISFENDALNAMLGMLEAYQDYYPDLFRHIWGLPVFYLPNRTQGDLMSHSLAWSPVGQGRRRRHFPSWSFVGWTQPIQHLSLMWTYDAKSPDVTVLLELIDGTTLDTAERLSNTTQFRALFSQLTKTIHIEADFVQVRIRPRSGEPYPNRWIATVLLKHPLAQGEGTAKNTFWFDDSPPERGFAGGSPDFVPLEEFTSADKLYTEFDAGMLWIGLMLRQKGFILVLRKIEGDMFERIGSMNGIGEAELQGAVMERKKIRLS